MWYEKWLEKNLIPDFLIRFGIQRQLAQKIKIEEHELLNPHHLEHFLELIKGSPIAVATQEANEQHYELPPEFFETVLGKYRKYSCGLWPEAVQTLDQSEEAMLDLYVERAEIKDGMSLLDLGCGWGSLSLYLAKRFPKSQVLGVSNSGPQRENILKNAKSQRISNLRIVTADMNSVEINETFDRVLSIEMFEHMRNYEKLFEKVSGWMKPEAKLFVHVFCHDQYAYLFDDRDPNNWMARYFFTGGMMPSRKLFRSFSSHLSVTKDWVVNGQHYQKTCEAWLQKMDVSRDRIFPLFEKTYGKKAATKWWVYWRVFFMACAELFGYQKGEQWYVAHYLFEKTKVSSLQESL